MTREELQALVRAKRREFYGADPLRINVCPSCEGRRTVRDDDAKEVSCPRCVST